MWFLAGPTPAAIDESFATLERWKTKTPHGAVRVLAHADGGDGYVAELRFPGDPMLGASDRVGPVRWPIEIGSLERTRFGTYRGRLRFASCAKDEELVSAFFVYANDGVDSDQNGITDNPEIDIEVLCGEPHLYWMTVWTDYQREGGGVRCRKQTRVVDMRDGSYRETPRSSPCGSVKGSIGRIEGLSIPDFPGDRFYEVGFDWYPDRVAYFIVHDGRETTLWELNGERWVPQHGAQLRLQLWHARAHWETGGLADYPSRDGLMLVDWARYWAAP